jgi:hypothetical protein
LNSALYANGINLLTSGLNEGGCWHKNVLRYCFSCGAIPAGAEVELKALHSALRFLPCMKLSTQLDWIHIAGGWTIQKSYLEAAMTARARPSVARPQIVVS